jgi:hypothetical protein
MVWGADFTDSWKAQSLRGYSLSEQAHALYLHFRFAAGADGASWSWEPPPRSQHNEHVQRAWKISHL